MNPTCCYFIAILAARLSGSCASGTAPCFAAGVQQCVTHGGNYHECICKPNYTGMQCQTGTSTHCFLPWVHVRAQLYSDAVSNRYVHTLLPTMSTSVSPTFRNTVSNRYIHTLLPTVYAHAIPTTHECSVKQVYICTEDYHECFCKSY